jgi:hypothetical protein
MRRRAVCLALALVSAAPAPPPPQAAAPPHAWLFGVWTGGLFPVPSNIGAEACLAQPTVIFTRDVVLRGTLTDVTYVQRVIATARTAAGRTEFRFAPGAPPAAASNSLLGLQAPPPAVGFGCPNPDALVVERRTNNEIVFPGCKDFPNPLIRCPAR